MTTDTPTNTPTEHDDLIAAGYDHGIVGNSHVYTLVARGAAPHRSAIYNGRWYASADFGANGLHAAGHPTHAAAIEALRDVARALLALEDLG